MVARRAGVVAGLAAVPMLIDEFGGRIRWTAGAHDGKRVGAGERLGTLSGPARDLLALERTLLNLVSRLSGVATRSAAYVEAVAGTGAVICDTRKTTPGLRALEKYAVRCGGATLHRIGLFDAALFKDNHLAGVAPGGLARAIESAAAGARSAAARNAQPLAFVEVEVDTLEQLRELLALPAGVVDIILLDNMPPEMLREAVRMRDEAGDRPLLEASGG